MEKILQQLEKLDKNIENTLDFKNILFVTTELTEKIKEKIENGYKITAINLNQDCYVAFLLAGITEIAKSHAKLPVIKVDENNLIGEGSNGKVYRVNEEVIAKVFKRAPAFDDILRERQLTRNALKAGVPAPISFGYATIDGKLALMLEFVHATSLAKLIRADERNIDKYISLYVGLIKTLHNISGKSLELFPRLRTDGEFRGKLERVSKIIDSAHQKKLAEIVNSVTKEPEVLIHGDIQPSNIKVSDGTASFIDLETISTGADIYDLGALYRTLFVRDEIANPDYNEFLKFPLSTCEKLWDVFTTEYYKDKDETYTKTHIQTATVLGLLINVDKLLRKHDNGEYLQPALAKLYAAIDGTPFKR